MKAYRTILFCTDFSKDADHAFDEAVYVATATSARLLILHVIPARGAGDAEAEEAWVQTCLERTYRDEASIETQVAVRRGNVTQEVLRYAEETQADVIIFGARGLGRLAGLATLGSIAAKLLKNSPVPVLVVPRHLTPEEQHLEEVAGRRGIPLRTDVGRVLRQIREAQEGERRASGRKEK